MGNFTKLNLVASIGGLIISLVIFCNAVASKWADFSQAASLEYRKTPFLSGIQTSCKDVQRIYQSQLDDS